MAGPPKPPKSPKPASPPGKPAASAVNQGKPASPAAAVAEKKRPALPPTGHSSLPLEHRTEAPLTRTGLFSLRKEIRSGLIALEKTRPRQVHLIPLNPKIYFAKPAQLKAHADSLKVIGKQLERLGEIRSFLRGDASASNPQMRPRVLHLLKIKEEQFAAVEGNLLPLFERRFTEEVAHLNSMVDRLNKGLPAVEPVLPKSAH